MFWTYDESVQKWLVLLDDIVIEVFDFEYEANKFIEREMKKWGIFQKVH